MFPRECSGRGVKLITDPPSSAEVKNEWGSTSTLPHACYDVRWHRFTGDWFYLEKLRVEAFTLTRFRLVNVYLRFGKAYQSDIQRSSAWPLKMGPIGCPVTSVTKDQPTLRKIPDRRPQIHRGGSRNLSSWGLCGWYAMRCILLFHARSLAYTVLHYS